MKCARLCQERVLVVGTIICSLHKVAKKDSLYVTRVLVRVLCVGSSWACNDFRAPVVAICA
jgi:hypothetical protein